MAVYSPSWAASTASFFILSSEKGKALLHPCSRSAPENVAGFWMPSQSDIFELEKLLGPFLKTTASGSSTLPLSRFRRQYIGFIKDGKKYIYGNFYLADSAYPNESTEPVVVCDGGKLFWGVVYVVDTKKFQELEFNGEI